MGDLIFLSLQLEARLLAEIEAFAQLPQHMDIAGATAAETMIVADQQFADAVAIEQDFLDERGWIERGEGRSERQDHAVVDTPLGDELELFLSCREEEWRC